MNALILLSLSLVLLGIVSFILGKRKKNEIFPGNDTLPEEPEECCGQHLVCEKDNLLATINKEIEYYDDEELDTFKLKDPASYNDDETEQFRAVLYTLAVQEVEEWLRSLQLREIALPLALRDEALMIVREQRINI